MLRKAAFWIYLRQDVQMAEKYCRGTRINLGRCFVTQGDLQDASDDARANHIMWIYAHIVNLCFGEEPSKEGWDQLKSLVRQWKDSLPGSFVPLHRSEPCHDEGNPFPVIWYLSDWHGKWMDPLPVTPQT